MNTPTEPKTETRNLGCLNDGTNTERDAIIRHCHELGHRPTDTNPTAPRSGLHYVECKACGYTYCYDTSD